MNKIVSDILERLDNVEKSNTNFEERITFNETYVKQQDIYSRRNNIELCNISENIHQRDLESFVVQMLNSAGIKIRSYDIVAVHRLGKFVAGKKRNVIVRFVNRKNAYKCFGLGKKLNKIEDYKNKRIYSIGNLCPTNKKIFNALYKLKKEKVIHSVWSRNGRIFYQENEIYNDYTEAISLDDIEYLFEEVAEEDDDRNVTPIANSGESE